MATIDEIETWSLERLCMANLALDYRDEVERIMTAPKPKGSR